MITLTAIIPIIAIVRKTLAIVMTITSAITIICNDSDSDNDNLITIMVMIMFTNQLSHHGTERTLLSIRA